MAKQPSRHAGAFLLIVGSTVIAIAGTDLVLPSIPVLPQTLGGSLADAQMVLAIFTAGSALGLMLFGELGARFDQRWLLAGSLLSYSLASWLCTFSSSVCGLIGLRFMQGVASSAAAVFAQAFCGGFMATQAPLARSAHLAASNRSFPLLLPCLEHGC